MAYRDAIKTVITVPRDGMAYVHRVVHDARHDEERLARKVGFRMRALGAID